MRRGADGVFLKQSGLITHFGGTRVDGVHDKAPEIVEGLSHTSKGVVPVVDAIRPSINFETNYS